jgi:hypothetical protein
MGQLRHYPECSLLSPELTGANTLTNCQLSIVNYQLLSEFQSYFKNR